MRAGRILGTYSAKATGDRPGSDLRRNENDLELLALRENGGSVAATAKVKVLELLARESALGLLVVTDDDSIGVTVLVDIVTIVLDLGDEAHRGAPAALEGGQLAGHHSGVHGDAEERHEKARPGSRQHFDLLGFLPRNEKPRNRESTQ